MPHIGIVRVFVAGDAEHIGNQSPRNGWMEKVASAANKDKIAVSQIPAQLFIVKVYRLLRITPASYIAVGAVEQTLTLDRIPADINKFIHIADDGLFHTLNSFIAPFVYSLKIVPGLT